MLGDIPLLGRMFRSKSESTQKRNLLIFVTANLVSPGGAPKKQILENVPQGSLYLGSDDHHAGWSGPAPLAGRYTPVKTPSGVILRERMEL